MDAKEKLFKTMERIDELRNVLFGLTEEEELELRNLEVFKMQYYSDWKDPQ